MPKKQPQSKPAPKRAAKAAPSTKAVKRTPLKTAKKVTKAKPAPRARLAKRSSKASAPKRRSFLSLHKRLIKAVSLELVLLLSVVGLIGSTASLVVVQAQSSAPQPVAVYRLYNPSIDEHFLTIYTAQRDEAIKTYGFKDDGIGFQAYATQIPNTQAVYRLYNSPTQGHLYTFAGSEREALLKDHNWVDEGVAFYAFPSSANSSVPVYRFSKPNGKHFFTINKAEGDAQVKNAHWGYEGVVFYAAGAQTQAGTGTSKPSPTASNSPTAPTATPKTTPSTEPAKISNPSTPTPTTSPTPSTSGGDVGSGNQGFRRVPANSQTPTVPPKQTASPSFDYASKLAPVYRFSSEGYDDQFFTTNTAESAGLNAGDSYCYEGVGFKAFTAEVPGSVAIYRFYNDKRHFFSVNAEEGKIAGYRLEGIAFYAFPVGSSMGADVYRLSNKSGKHLFTVGAGEKNAVLADKNWTDEGVGFKAGSAQGEAGPKCSKPAKKPAPVATAQPTAPAPGAPSDVRNVSPTPTPSTGGGGTGGGTTAPPTPTYYNTNCEYHRLEKGMKEPKTATDGCIHHAQRLLIIAGFLPQGSDDGDFGKNTYNATYAFQQTHGVSPSGAIDNPTWLALECVNNCYSTSPPVRDGNATSTELNVSMEGPKTMDGLILHKFGNKVSANQGSYFENCYFTYREDRPGKPELRTEANNENCIYSLDYVRLFYYWPSK